MKIINDEKGSAAIFFKNKATPPRLITLKKGGEYANIGYIIKLVKP